MVGLSTGEIKAELLRVRSRRTQRPRTEVSYAASFFLLLRFLCRAAEKAPSPCDPQQPGTPRLCLSPGF